MGMSAYGQNKFLKYLSKCFQVKKWVSYIKKPISRLKSFKDTNINN